MTLKTIMVLLMEKQIKKLNDQWEILNSHKGKTTSLVTIYYSDKEKGAQ